MRTSERLKRTASVVTGILVLLAAWQASAGDIVPDKVVVVEEPGSFLPAWIVPSLDSRFRWEYGDEDGKDTSNALTLRNRAGVLLKPGAGFSFFSEYEGTLVADRDGYQAASVHGLGKNKTVIPDPASHELNQLWVAYEFADTEVKAGRQRIILDNHRFVGNVGWRQNEQTFDAVTLTNHSVENLSLFYSYVNRANRIFGSGDIHDPSQEDFIGNSHLLNASYVACKAATVTGYAYFLDLHNAAGDGASNNTYGIQAKGAIPAGADLSVPYLLETAFQTDGADSPRDYSAWYWHAEAGVDTGTLTVGAGYENLGADNGTGFQTPIATLHLFNGWADKFLATPADGLSDVYVYSKASLPWKITFQSAFHWFGPDTGGFDYGTEVDASLIYPLNKNVTLGAKYAQFFADEFGTDTARVIVDVGIKF